MSKVNYKRLEAVDSESKEIFISESGPRNLGDDTFTLALSRHGRDSQSRHCWSMWSWRTAFEALLIVAAMLSLTFAHFRQPIELGPGSAPFVHSKAPEMLQLYFSQTTTQSLQFPPKSRPATTGSRLTCFTTRQLSWTRRAASTSSQGVGSSCSLSCFASYG